jgi:tetratricopeptide (TPR) repeat protein
MRRLVVALTLGVLCTGCGTVDWFREKREARSEAAQLVGRADELIREGQPSAARDLYARIVAEAPRDAVHARALHSLARLYVDPASGLRDYRAARQAFARLLTDYPNGEWESEARTWQAALTELEAREAELVTREAEATRLKTEAVKLGADLQRLKRIDMNLERRR